MPETNQILQEEIKQDRAPSKIKFRTILFSSQNSLSIYGFTGNCFNPIAGAAQCGMK